MDANDTDGADLPDEKASSKDKLKERKDDQRVWKNERAGRPNEPVKDPEGSLSDLSDHDGDDKSHKARNEAKSNLELDVGCRRYDGPDDIVDKLVQLVYWIRRSTEIGKPGAVLGSLAKGKDGCRGRIGKVIEAMEAFPRWVVAKLGHLGDG